MLLDAGINLTTAALLGGMLFFAAVVAPLVFQVLPADTAGQFLRALFPRYYAYIAITSGLAAVLSYATPWKAAVLAAVCITTIAVREALVPQLNRWRDAEIGGDGAAGRRFATGHRASVLINVAQLLAVIAVIGVRG